MGVENTESNRQAWRELLYSAPGLGNVSISSLSLSLSKRKILRTLMPHAIPISLTNMYHFKSMYHSQVKHGRGFEKIPIPIDATCNPNFLQYVSFQINVPFVFGRLVVEEKINSMECYAKKSLVINFAVAVHKWCHHV